MKLSLLDLLYNTKDWMKVTTLCIKTNIGEKKVVRYMEELIQDCSQVYILEKTSAEIKYIKGKGYIFIGKEIDYKKIYVYILQQSLIFIVLQRLFLRRQVITSDILNSYFVSESTLRRKILQIDNYLASYNLSLKYSTKQLVISGSEITIRYLGYQFFWTFYTGVNWPFTHVDRTKVVYFVKNALKNYNLAQKNTLVQELSYMFALNISRFHSNHPINDSEIPLYIQKINHEILFSNASFYQDFKKEYLLSDGELEFIGLLFQCRAQFYVKKDKLQEVIQQHRQLDTPIYRLYTLFTEETNVMYTPVKTKLNLKICHAIILSTFLHASFFIDFSSVASGYDLSFFYRENYPHLYSYMEGVLERMSQKSSSTVLENADFLLPRFCEAFSAINIFTKFEPKIIVKIDTNLTMALEYALTQKLEQIFQNFYNVRFLSFIEIDQKETQNYDLVFSSIIQNSEDNPYRGTPFYTFEPQINLSDLSKINSILADYIKNIEQRNDLLN